MKNKFIIDHVYAKDRKIYYEYRVEGEENFKKLFWLGEFFSVEYNEEIEGVPESVLVIPLLCNILPIIWVNNATVYLNEIDKTFYKSIDEIKKGYKDMLPYIHFKGKLKAKKKIKNDYEVTNRKATFFSGGVDSYSTLIRNMEEKPDLITIWGADIDFENEEGWKVVKQYVEGIGKKYHLKNVLIRTALRRFIDNSEHEKQYHELLDDNWWHSMQHGIGLIGNVAPYAYKYKLQTIYIPSTYTKEDKEIVCASRPEIDDKVKFGNTTVFCEGTDYNRQQKVNGISKYIKDKKDNITLRVCYRSLDGDNCCNCEKCYRTIMSFISQKINPNDIGFTVDKQKMQQIKEEMQREDILDTVGANILWKDIREAFEEDEAYWKDNEDVNWIFNFKKGKTNVKDKKIELTK